MNDKIISETVSLVDKIKKSQEYIDYLNYRSILERNPELLRETEQFRRKYFEIQMSHQYGAFNAYENLISLRQESEEILSDPVVKAFLDAELNLSKLLATVYDTIAENIQFDIRFLD